MSLTSIDAQHGIEGRRLGRSVGSLMVAASLLCCVPNQSIFIQTSSNNRAEDNKGVCIQMRYMLKLLLPPDTTATLTEVTETSDGNWQFLYTPTPGDVRTCTVAPIRPTPRGVGANLIIADEDINSHLREEIAHIQGAAFNELLRPSV